MYYLVKRRRRNIIVMPVGWLVLEIKKLPREGKKAIDSNNKDRKIVRVQMLNQGR